MRNVIGIVLLATLAMNISGCAYKNKLRTPAQIESDEAKKAKREAKKVAGERNDEELLPAFMPKDERAQ